MNDVLHVMDVILDIILDFMEYFLDVILDVLDVNQILCQLLWMIL